MSPRLRVCLERSAAKREHPCLLPMHEHVDGIASSLSTTSSTKPKATRNHRHSHSVIMPRRPTFNPVDVGQYETISHSRGITLTVLPDKIIAARVRRMEVDRVYWVSGMAPLFYGRADELANVWKDYRAIVCLSLGIVQLTNDIVVHFSYLITRSLVQWRGNF